MTTHYSQAEHWLEESFHRDDPAAGRECLLTAQVYATLAVADVIASALESLGNDLTGKKRW
jgi:hypothetical protein